jgi:hypothetical protein
VRDWLLGSKALEMGGLSFVLVEFIPYYDEPEGKRDLRQEILLIGRHGEASKACFSHRLIEYNGVAGALQRENLGLYQHDFMTGAGMEAGPCSGPVLISEMKGGESAGRGWGRRQQEWLQAKREAVSRPTPRSPPEGAADADLLPLFVQTPSTEPEYGVTEGHFYGWSAERLARIGILPDRATIEAIRARARREHAASEDEYQKTDFALTLDLAHEMLRHRFSVTDERVTWLSAARLETNDRCGNEEPDEDGIPRSYRGAVWVFAEGKGEHPCSKDSVLHEMLRVCLVAGNISVEAQAGAALAKGIRRFATRTASVAIMSRNMSHNLGSHVLSGVVAQKPAAPGGDFQMIAERHDLLRYLQERMDFLAEVSTSGAFMAAPLSLETILWSFQCQHLLRNHISGLADPDGDPVPAFITQYGDRLLDGPNLLVLSPGGRNGCHAFYVILENIIRNSAKHSHSEAVPLEIDIGVRAEVADHLVRVVVWDRADNADLKRYEGTNLGFLTSIIEQGEMITREGALKRGSWGIREMMIAAAYLRGLPLEDIEAAKGISPALLRAVRVDDDGRHTEAGAQANIGFEFYLRRPQILCVIDEALTRKLRPESLRNLSRQGIAVHASSEEASKHCRDFSYVAVEGDTLLAPVSDWPHRRLAVGPVLASLLARSDISSEELAHLAWKEAARAWQEELQSRHGLHDLVVSASGANLDLPDWNYLDERGQKVSFVRHPPAGPDIEAKIRAISQHLFWEHYDGGYDQVSMIENPPEGLEEPIKHEFIAAALARIVILDERVQSAVETHPGYSNGRLTMSEAIDRRRICVPSSTKCPLKGEISWRNVEAYLADVSSEPIDLLVVHLGILERIAPREGWQQTLGKLLHWADQQHQTPEIVICSGRGSNEAQAVDQRFVPASAVERWTVHVPSKFHLYQLLASSRRPVAMNEAQT